MSTNDSSGDLDAAVVAVVTAMIKFRRDKHRQYEVALAADEAAGFTRFERREAHAESMAAMEAYGAACCALIGAGVPLDRIREIEAALVTEVDGNVVIA